MATIDRFPVRASVQNKSIFPATFHTFPGIRTWEPTAIPLPRVAVMAMNSYKWKYKPHNQGYISLYIVIKPFKTVSWAITVRLTLFFSTPVCFRAALSSCHFTATARIDSRFHGPGYVHIFLVSDKTNWIG